MSTVGIDGSTVAQDLTRIGYAGEIGTGDVQPEAFVELHVEQGPVLEEVGIEIGAVTGVQGISWTEYTIAGVSIAGTTRCGCQRRRLCCSGHRYGSTADRR